MASEVPNPLNDSDRAALGPPPLGGEGLEAMLARVREDTIDRPVTARERARTLPTAMRVGLAVLAVSVVGLVLSNGVRDPNLFTTAQKVLLLTAWLSAAGGVAVALRGMHAPVASTFERALVGLSVVVPLMLAAASWPGAPSDPAHFLAALVPCGSMGMLTSLVAAVVVLALHRSDRPGPMSLLAAASAGGLVGFLGRVAHCPANDLAHSLLAHGALGLGAALVLFGVAGWRAAR
jgi:hypothetical protein